MQAKESLTNIVNELTTEQAWELDYDIQQVNRELRFREPQFPVDENGNMISLDGDNRQKFCPSCEEPVDQSEWYAYQYCWNCGQYIRRLREKE